MFAASGRVGTVQLGVWVTHPLRSEPVARVQGLTY